MAEYIEREALIAAYDKAHKGPPGGARKLMEDAPAVDVVEVVRCKDCKHHREKNEHERLYLFEAVLICTSSDATDDCWNPVWPNHFCSYGERRESDG